MNKNDAIDLAIKAIHKVKPGIADSRMSERHREDYDKLMDAIQILKNLKDPKKRRKNGSPS